MEKKLVFQSTITCVCAGVKLTYKSNELVIVVTASTAQSVVIPYIRTTPIQQTDYFPRIYACTPPICQPHSPQVYTSPSSICQHGYSPQVYANTSSICQHDCYTQICTLCKNTSIFNPRKTLAHLKNSLCQSVRKMSSCFHISNSTSKGCKTLHAEKQPSNKKHGI